MAEQQNLDKNHSLKPSPHSNNELKSSHHNGGSSSSSTSSSGTNTRYRNPPETKIPDPETLRGQWRFAVRQYSRWYAHAWGTAILAGVSFFALGWIIKGSNPLPSFNQSSDPPPPSPSADGDDKARK